MRTIPLTKGLHAIVDDEDFYFLNKWSWYAVQYGRAYYAVRCDRTTGRSIRIRMHTVIMGKRPEKTVIDHINGDSLDNRKNNLRFATYSQNTGNTHAVKNKHGATGICKVMTNGTPRWRSRITLQGKRIYLGTFLFREQAVIAYLCARVIRTSTVPLRWKTWL